MLPIIAVVSPGFATKFISSSISVSASGYLNDTSLNSTYPFLPSTNSFVSVLSSIEGSVSNTSLIRFAETEALGSIIDIIDMNKKDITICIVY